MSKPLLPFRCTSHTLHAPLRRRRVLYNPHHETPSASNPHRTFHTHPPSRLPNMRPPGTRKGTAPSMALAEKRQQAEMLRTGGIPDDIGILPQTFVMPLRKDRPSPFKMPRQRLRLEWIRVKARFWELVQNHLFKYWQVKPRPHLNYFGAARLARDLHKSLYSALAAGNIRDIESSLVPSFAQNLRASIQKRPTNHFYTFEIVKYLSAPKLMCLKAGVAPAPPGVNEGKDEKNGAQQAVVRLHTLQRAQEMRRKQVREQASGKLKVVEEKVEGKEMVEREVVDYFVVQRMLRRSKLGPWKVFGHTQPTSWKELERERERKEREVGSVAWRFKRLLPSFMR